VRSRGAGAKKGFWNSYPLLSPHFAQFLDDFMDVHSGNRLMVFRILQRMAMPAAQIVPINPPPAPLRLDPSYGYCLRPLVEVDF